MASAEITTDFTIAAPLASVWDAFRDPRSMQHWQGVTRVEHDPKGWLIVGELKLPIGAPVSVTSRIAIQDERIDGHAATATLVIENPRTTLRWSFSRRGDEETFCALSVVYLTPSGMLGMVMNGSILKKVIVDNIRGYVRKMRQELAPEAAAPAA